MGRPRFDKSNVMITLFSDFSISNLNANFLRWLLQFHGSWQLLMIFNLFYSLHSVKVGAVLEAWCCLQGSNLCSLIMVAAWSEAASISRRPILTINGSCFTQPSSFPSCSDDALPLRLSKTRFDSQKKHHFQFLFPHLLVQSQRKRNQRLVIRFICFSSLRIS